MQMGVHLMLSQKSQTIFISFHSFFFYCSAWMVSIILSSRALIIPLYHLIYCRFLLVHFLFHLSYSLAVSSFIFSNSLLKFSLCSPILLPSSLSIFMTIALNSLLGRLLFPLCLFLFMRFCLVLLFGTYSSFSSFCLILCVYFYV